MESTPCYVQIALSKEEATMVNRKNKTETDKSNTSKNDLNNGLTRRGFLKGAGAGVVTAAVTPAATFATGDSSPTPSDDDGLLTATLRLEINGQSHNLQVEARNTLADALRDKLDITGPKVVCDRGECGACTVILDGKLVFSCMTLALDANGKKIETVEGLADGEELHPLQEAFIEKDALMCGFCTPGFLMSSKALLETNANPTPEEIKEGLSGNICRCGTYPHVFEAVNSAAKKMRNGG